jgi:NitT/TauT family transport system substrate-binding protein
MQKKILIVALIVIGVVVYYIFSTKLVGQKQPKKSLKTVKVAVTSSQLVDALAYIAYRKGYFQEEGLDVVFQLQASGKEALASLTLGKADFAFSTETPIVFTILNLQKIYIIATAGSTEENVGVMVLKKSGITELQGLKGKKIGVMIGSHNEFLLDITLMLNGMLKQDVILVNVAMDEMATALGEGRVDGVAIGNPYIAKLEKALSNQTVTFTHNEFYLWSKNVAIRQDYIQDNQKTVENFLFALVKAEQHIYEDVKDSQQIIADSLKLDKTTVANLWDNYHFEVRLEQQLLAIFEDQVNWAIQDKAIDKATIPNFLNYLYPKALAAVKPDRVTVISAKD